LKLFAFFTVMACGGLLIYATTDFPAWGDPFSPAGTFVSPGYIETALRDTAVPNLVTAVLADYRGFDTMLETAVIFVAGMVCHFLLRTFEPSKTKTRLYRHLSTNIVVKIASGSRLPKDSTRFERIDGIWTPHDLIIKSTCRLVIPFIQLFALYVIAHGHHSPGGGFQGGVILGASMILFAISHDLRSAIRRIGEKTSAVLSSTGVLIYCGTGILCLLMGTVFLDYGALAPIFQSNAVMARSHGILIVEIGVGMAVMAVMVWIYYNISSAGKHDEGL